MIFVVVFRRAESRAGSLERFPVVVASLCFGARFRSQLNCKREQEMQREEGGGWVINSKLWIHLFSAQQEGIEMEGTTSLSSWNLLHWNQSILGSSVDVTRSIASVLRDAAQAAVA